MPLRQSSLQEPLVHLTSQDPSHENFFLAAVAKKHGPYGWVSGRPASADWGVGSTSVAVTGCAETGDDVIAIRAVARVKRNQLDIGDPPLARFQKATSRPGPRGAHG